MTRMAHAYAQAPVMTRMALAHARASDESDGTRAPVMTRNLITVRKDTPRSRRQSESPPARLRTLPCLIWNPITVRKPSRRAHGVGPPPRVSVSVDSHGVSPVTASSHGVQSRRPVTASVHSHGVGPSSQAPCEAAPPRSNPLSEPPRYSSLSSESLSPLDPCPGLPAGPVDLGPVPP